MRTFKDSRVEKKSKDKKKKVCKERLIRNQEGTVQRKPRGEFLCSCLHTCVLSHLSQVQLCATLWTATCQSSLSVGFSRQEYGSGLLCSLFLAALGLCC